MGGELSPPHRLLFSTCISPIMHLICLPNFAQPLFVISPGYYSRPKQCLCKVFFWGGGGGEHIRCIMGDVQVAYWKKYPQSPHSGEYRQRSSQTKLAKLKQSFKVKAIISSVKKK